jgi:hypothetical protein
MRFGSNNNQAVDHLSGGYHVHQQETGISN